jgi:thymidine kinase
MTHGFLELILGPMFSGKTTRLIEIYNKYNRSSKKVCVINYVKDTRYHEDMLSSHDRKMIPCIFADKLSSIINKEEVVNADIILINEGQFFEDVFESVEILVEKMNKRVYICGLDGDFKRNSFGTLLNLIPLCDNVTKLHSNCNSCNNEALFSHRISDEKELVVIGSSNYVPLCRNCYNNMNNA